jgi:hypothetical protein
MDQCVDLLSDIIAIASLLDKPAIASIFETSTAYYLCNYGRSDGVSVRLWSLKEGLMPPRPLPGIIFYNFLG